MESEHFDRLIGSLGQSAEPARRAAHRGRHLWPWWSEPAGTAGHVGQEAQEAQEATEQRLTAGLAAADEHTGEPVSGGVDLQHRAERLRDGGDG